MGCWGMTGRISRVEALLQTAHVWADRSTCDRLHVGCVIAREGRILVQGYNGAPSGLPHCVHEKEILESDEGVIKEYWSDGPCITAEHAERNAIAWAARNGVKLKGAEMYITHMPCLPCAMSIINAGIYKVVYREPYRLTDGVELLERAGITVYQVDDSGKVV